MARSGQTRGRRCAATGTALALLAAGLVAGFGAPARAATDSGAASPGGEAGASVPLHPVGGVVMSSRRVSAVDVVRREYGSAAVLSLSAPTVGVEAVGVDGSGDGSGVYGAGPASVDLRDDTDSDGNVMLPPVGDQGQVGSCLPWTVAYTLMGYYAEKDDDHGAPYSPLYLYMRNTSSAPSAGTNPEQVLTFAAAQGVDTEDDYFQGYYGWQVAPTAAEKANAANYKVTSWDTLWVGPNLAGSSGLAARQALVEAALAAGDPVIIGFDVYSSFDTIHDTTLYTANSGYYRGGHMVTLVGYDGQGPWLRNQWGTAWGASGDAHVSWDWVTQNVFGAYTITGVTAPSSGSAAGNPKAVITGMTGTSGPATGGTAVTLTGSNLRGATAVNFGSTSVALQSSDISTVNGVTTISVTSPAGTPGGQYVTVTNGGGTGATSSTAVFTYQGVSPNVDGGSMSPTAAASEGGTRITLTGTNLTGSTVYVDGRIVATSTMTVTDTALSFVAPPHAAGVVPVEIRSSYGRSTVGNLTYAATDPPVITALSTQSVSALQATTVTVTGTSLKQVKKAYVAGLDVPFTKVGDTQLVLSLPRTSVNLSGDVILEATWSTSATSAATAFAFVVPARPDVTAITGAAINLPVTPTLTGTDLQGATKVTIISSTNVKSYGWRIAPAADGLSLRFTMPRLAAGTYDLIVTTPSGDSDRFSFTL